MKVMRQQAQRQTGRASVVALLCAFVLASLIGPICAFASACAMPCCHHGASSSAIALAATPPCCTFNGSMPSPNFEVVLVTAPNNSIAAVLPPSRLIATPQLQPHDIGVAATSPRPCGERCIHLVNSVFLI
jgi:hypothetical protein